MNPKERVKFAYKKNDAKKFDDERFEFVLYVNNNIICQRFFDIPDYNEDSTKSVELKELIDELTSMNTDSIGSLGVIPKFLKDKSVDYLWNSYNPYIPQTSESYKYPPKKGDMFKFEIKVDKKPIAVSEFPNEFFTLNPKISVDIRQIIPTIMSEIKGTLSRKKYTIDKATMGWKKSVEQFLKY